MVMNALTTTVMRSKQYESEVRSYEISWGGVLDTATISSSTWAVDPTGTVAAEVTGTDSVSCTFAGAENDYELENTLVASDGQTHVRYFRIEIVADPV